MTIITDTLREDHFTFIIISHSVLQRMRNLQTDFVEKITTYILRSITFIRHRALYEITCKDIVESDSPQVKILRVRITRWIPTATHTHTR